MIFILKGGAGLNGKQKKKKSLFLTGKKLFFFSLMSNLNKIFLSFFLQNISITWSNNATWPQFTQCFQNTILMWLPCIWLWCCLPFYLYFMYKHCSNTIPYTWINISKNVSMPSYLFILIKLRTISIFISFCIKLRMVLYK